MRHPQGAIAQGIARVGENDVCTSTIVASELRFWAAKRTPRLTAQVEAILSAIEVRPFDTLPTTNTPAFVLTFTPPVLRAPS